MADQRVELFEHMMTAILTTSGDTSSSLRTSLARQAARLYNDPTSEDGDLPSELAVLVKKVACHAYRVTDQDVEQVRAHGYSDHAILEITLSVASGVSQSCLTRGLKALEEASNEIRSH
ncbi:hypothetical protein [Dictyobacter aurantiacus]|uniref:Carboxymuconolactone decarboxylase-like domain-containing protein n=1 Tax=Dictyobacter aurantiacus TaxID=1936993 RepID=A0A401ZLG6_9CHLR|nr:hypothetical protein [Dictyobacter aurantiacus]GCE07686.1 hypothetical protein KDAU_50150 [Dictyobacter aurantiacus]